MIFSVKYVTKEHYHASEKVCPSCSKQASTTHVANVEPEECTETGEFLECTNCNAILFVHSNPEIAIADLSPVDVRWNIQVARM